jgi:hypothetical protein
MIVEYVTSNPDPEYGKEMLIVAEELKRALMHYGQNEFKPPIW